MTPCFARLVLLAIVLAGWIWPAVAHAEAPSDSSRRPNIVLIMIDDMSRDWVGCYGGSGKTPRIDSLAEQGLKFDVCWCTPLCTPTRMELLTGRYGFRTGWINHFDVPRWGGSGFDPEKEICWARPIRDAGYATAIAGKWQINDLRNPPDILSRHGFDAHCMWPGVEDGNPPTQERYWNGYYQINGERKSRDGQFGPDVVNKFACDFVRENRDRPFLLYYPMVLVHSPYVPVPNENGEQPARQRGNNKQLYGSMVTYADKLIGQLLDTLEETGVAENTVVIFTCDNGSSVGGSLNGEGVAAAKSKLTNAGVHVPLIVRWPGRVKAQTSTANLTDFTDIYPTLTELSGATVPSGVELDGRSLVPVLTGKAQSTGREWIYSYLNEGRTVRDARWRLDNQGRMYDLESDPQETRVVNNVNTPEVATARQKLQAVLDSFPENAPAPYKKR
jgi:arylsulfatase A-like enzyme